MKRVTWWPQAFLGLTFNWGALVAWAAVTGYIGIPAWLLYIGGIGWTLGYDTIYAHQDKEDDMRIGVKSTALLWGARSRQWIAGFYGLATVWRIFSGRCLRCALTTRRAACACSNPIRCWDGFSSAACGSTA
jgi:4-hydroxybenzoate polyprenyltransferase